jgi:hypothetical protein
VAIRNRAPRASPSRNWIWRPSPWFVARVKHSDPIPRHDCKGSC